MSLLDSIYGFQTGTYTVTRRAEGTWTDGIYIPNPTTTTLAIRGVVQPAREIQRVVGGRDMREREQNQYVDDVQVIHTDTEIWTRKPGYDPDMITVDGGQWHVIRVEKWTIGGVTFWMGVITRETNGAS